MSPDLSQKQIHLQLFAAALGGLIANEVGGKLLRGGVKENEIGSSMAEIAFDYADAALKAFNERWKE